MIIITSTATGIKFSDGAGWDLDVPREKVSVRLKEDNILFMFGSGVQPVSLSFLYTEVTTPSAASAADLLVLIEAMLVPEIEVTGEVTIDSSTPVDITGEVTIDSSTPVNITGTVEVEGASASPNADFKIGTYGGTVTFLSSSSLTLGGAYPTISNDAQILYVTVIPSSGTPSMYINGDGTHKLTHSAGVITLVGATPFASGDQYEVGLSAAPIGADLANNAIMTEELSPAKTKFTNSETLVSEVDQATATTNRYIFDVSDSGYRFWSLHYKIFADTADDDTTEQYGEQTMMLQMILLIPAG